MITETQRTEYIESGGVCCPICKSQNIVGESFECDAGIAWQEVGCSDCEANWVDNYTLTSIRMQDEK